MRKVAFPSYDVQTMNGWSGGTASFIVNFARQLRAWGDEVTIIAMQRRVDPEWRERYRSWGINIIEICNEVAPERWPKIWPVTLSEYLTPLLSNFDIVYFHDTGNPAFNIVRMKRMGAQSMPICVTVMHGSLNWIHLLEDDPLEFPVHLHNVFVEQYAARHSDYVIAPSEAIAKWSDHEGWRLPRKPDVLGLPFIPRPKQSQSQQAGQLRRLVYFARLQRQKGYPLLVDALFLLQREAPEVLTQLDEVVLLGSEDVPGAAGWVQEKLRSIGLSVVHYGNFDSLKAQDYLASHVSDALVVIPSAYENFPNAAIESSLISGLNILCTRGGGTPEIFGNRGEAQLFDPTPDSLAARIRERLRQPLRPSELVQYDFATHNERWLKFHDRISNGARTRKPVVATQTMARVDVCIRYFNNASQFPHLLDSLKLQTYPNFRVIAVDDGSDALNSAALFDYMADKYRGQDWVFFRESSNSANASRNRASEKADGDYLLFVAADDVLVPNAIERLVQAAQYSGDDCLTPGCLHFSGPQFPFDKRTGRPTTQVLRAEMPLGPAIAASVMDPSILCSGVILIRRSVFKAAGGFKELPSTNLGNWALQIKLATSGCRTDVVPEYLYYERKYAEGTHREADRVSTNRHLTDQVDEALATIDLKGAASALRFNTETLLQRKSQEDFLSNQLKLTHQRFNAFGFVPLAAEGAVPRAASPVARNTPAWTRSTKVLIVIPTLNIGGAEMDLLRNLPNLDRSKFEVAVFTFFSRGTLASRLEDYGIEVVGPFFPFPMRWLGDVRHAIAGLFHNLWRVALLSITTTVAFAARTAPEWTRQIARRLRQWVRSRKTRRMRRLRTIILGIGIVVKKIWKRGLIQLKTSVGSLIGQCQVLISRLPRPLRRLIREVAAWTSYVTIGLVLAPFVSIRKIDLLHTVLPNSYVVGSLVKLWTNKPSLVMSRVGLNSYQQEHALRRFVERKLCHRMIGAAVGNCEAIVNELRDEGLPDSKLRLVRNGIDLADFSWQMVERGWARESLGVPEATIVISKVANLHPYKGHADLLRAMQYVSGDMPDWILVLVGRSIDGSRERLERLADELGIRRRVRFLGQRTDIPTILSAADIHVSSSHTDGLPNNILEAMCAGLPVVATAVGGVGELLVDGETGTLVPPRDPISLGQAIRTLAHAEDARHRMGLLGRKRVATHFTIDQSVDAWSRLYDEAIIASRQRERVRSQHLTQGRQAP